MGKEIKVEKSSSRVRKIFNWLDESIYKAAFIHQSTRVLLHASIIIMISLINHSSSTSIL